MSGAVVCNCHNCTSIPGVEQDAPDFFMISREDSCQVVTHITFSTSVK